MKKSKYRSKHDIELGKKLRVIKQKVKQIVKHYDYF